MCYHKIHQPSMQCPVDNCYSLQMQDDDLLSGSMNTTVALLPGIHIYAIANKIVTFSYHATNFTFRAANSCEGAMHCSVHGSLWI